MNDKIYDENSGLFTYGGKQLIGLLLMGTTNLLGNKDDDMTT